MGQRLARLQEHGGERSRLGSDCVAKNFVDSSAMNEGWSWVKNILGSIGAN